MNEKNRPRPRGERAGKAPSKGPTRPPSGGGPRPGRPRGPSAEDLLEADEEREEQGRELLWRARQFKRMAQSLGGGERGDRPRAARPPRGSGSGEDRPRRPEGK